MKNNIQYSVLSYYPSFITTECIHVGIAFENMETSEMRFEIIKNWTRLSTFDDELNIDMFKMLLYGIKSDIENMSRDFNKGNLKSYTKYYVNELKFSKPIEVYDENFNLFMETAKKMYLRYDYEKSARPNKDEQLKYFRRIINDQDLRYSCKPIKGEFSESISFDYIIDSKYAIKLFDFKEKDINRCISNIKLWSYNTNEIKEKYDVVFIYNIDFGVKDEEIKSNFDIIYRIMKKTTRHVYNIAEGTDFLNRISEGTDKNRQITIKS